MITPYTGQPLAAGMIVCRQSIMTDGFAARPVTIVRVAKSQLIVADKDGEHRVAAHTVAFVVDTVDEGLALAKANSDFLDRERQIAKEQAAAKAERRRETIERVLGGDLL